MAIKTDMEKAYDRIEWDLLLKVLKNFGFHSKGIWWVEQCITMASFAIILNGGPFERINPPRGIKQGDPLSPSLFILCSEVLSLLLLKEEKAGRLKGIRLCCDAPSINPLLFADDLPLFAKAIVRVAANLDGCLKKYMGWSGQKLNNSKSSIHFSKNFQGQPALHIMDMLDLKRRPSKAKHLGLSLLIPCSHR